MIINFTKKYNFKTNSIFSFFKLSFLKFLIFNLLSLTIFFILFFSPQIMAQQISVGFCSDFLPFSYSSTFNEIKNNIYYNAFVLLNLNISQSTSFGILIQRNTFNPFQPNSISFSLSFNKDFFTISDSLKVEISDDFSTIFPYFENLTSILLDFYPIFFFFISFKNPIYIQPLFSALIDIPKEETFENIRINLETGFYIYQMSIGLSFYYDKILYNFDIEQDPFVYDKLETYDIALVIKYVPTFTLFGFIVNIGYSYNDLLTQTPANYIHQFLYTKVKLIFTITSFKIEPSFGYLIYSVYSSNIASLNNMNRLYYSLTISYIF